MLILLNHLYQNTQLNFRLNESCVFNGQSLYALNRFFLNESEQSTLGIRCKFFNYEMSIPIDKALTLEGFFKSSVSPVKRFNLFAFWSSCTAPNTED